LRYAAVLRGVAYARYRQRDSNQIEITLSPPALPSRLMEILPKQGFSWTRLYDTKDSLIELASQAERRLVIISPFLDREGLEWIGQLFEATAKKSIQRTMIVRGRDQTETDVLRKHSSHSLPPRAWKFSPTQYRTILHLGVLPLRRFTPRSFSPTATRPTSGLQT